MRRYSTAVPLGSGASSEVLEVWDPELERPVAIKYLRRTDARSAERALREARAQARIDHPNVGKVYEVGKDEGKPYIAMQLIRGLPINEALASSSLEAKIRVMKTAAEAVQAAHSAGLLHRDLKPHNLLVEEDENGELTPYVLDFGIARELDQPGETRTGEFIGTPGYISPEQARGEIRSLDRRSDVFSLGVLLYEVLAGRLPYEGDSAAELTVRLLQDEPRPLAAVAQGVPQDLATIVMKCLDPRPAGRYGSAAALARDLGHWLDGEPIEARATSRVAVWARRARRRPALTAAVSIAVIALITATAIAVGARQRSATEARLAARYGRFVEQIDYELRLAYMLPRHDIRQDRERAHSALEELRREVDAAGGAGRAQGQVALGRALLRLGRWKKARPHLEAAWDQGLRRHDVALALGRTLTALHSERLREIERIDEEFARQEALASAERDLMQPAREMLRFAVEFAPEDLGHERLWLEGMSALNQGDTERARDKGLAATAATPWFYEGELLAVEADLRRAAGARLEVGLQQAGAALDRAEDILRSVTGKAPSDPLPQLLLCRVEAMRVDLAYSSGEDTEAPYAGAETECGLARSIDPDDSSILAERAYAGSRRALALIQRGRDPESPLEDVERAANQLLARDPDAAEPRRYLGSVHWTRAQRAYDLNDDPLPVAQRAADQYRAALRAGLDDPEARLEFAAILIGQGRWQSNLGEDPLPAWQEALAVYQELEPERRRLEARLETGRCDVLTEIGYYLFLLGRESGAALKSAVAACERAVTLAPGSLRARGRLGYAHWSLAEVRVAAGEDAAASFLAAAESIDHVLEAHPDRMGDRVNLSHLLEEYADWLREQGSDPAVWLRRAEDHTKIYRDVYPGDYALIQGKIELVRALSSFGPEAEAAWAGAQRLARDLERLLPEALTTYEFIAELSYERARSLAPDTASSRTSRTSRLLAEGSRAAERALEIDPGREKVLALRERIQRLRDTLGVPGP